MEGLPGFIKFLILMSGPATALLGLFCVAVIWPKKNELHLLSLNEATRAYILSALFFFNAIFVGICWKGMLILTFQP